MADDTIPAAPPPDPRDILRQMLTGANIPASLIDTLMSGVDTGAIQGMTDSGLILSAARKTPTWQQAFPGMTERNTKMPDSPVNEAQWISNKNAYNKVLTDNGMQPLADEDVGRQIVNDVSPAEFGTQVSRAHDAALNSDMSQEIQQMFGISQTAMAHFFLDPEKGKDIVAREWNDIQMGTAARRGGMGGLNLSQNEIEGMAAGGESAAQLGQRAGQLFQNRELLQALPGERQDVSRSTQVNFLAGETAAQEELAKKAQSRVAEFGGGGGIQTSAKGVGGLATEQ